MDFRILGPLEVWDRGHQVELRRRTHRALLAALLLRLGQFASVDQLVDDLWAEEPPATAKGSLQNMVSALRKALGADTIVTRSAAYALDVEREDVDLFRFERLLEKARLAAGAQERAETLQQALALWRGAVLEDLAFEPFVLLESPRLEERRLAAREELFEAQLALGEHAKLIPPLEALVAEHPYNERLRGQLMLALYRAGRQADALELYRDARQILVEELGLEPSTPLRELEQAILRHDPALAPASARPKSLQPTRRIATVLYADLVAPSALSGELDPEALSQLLTSHSDAAQQALERYGGAVQTLPSGVIFAVFGVPLAHEDDALRALHAALELRDQFEALGGGLAPRVGVSTGEVFAGGPTGLVTGAVVKLAKELAEAASANEIVLGATTVRLVRDAANLKPRAPLFLAEEQPLRAWRLLDLIEGAPAIPRRFGAPLVGRRHELAELLRAFEATRSDSRCRLLVLAGEPGIGKTRLMREFLAEVTQEATALIGRCVASGQGATRLPLLEILREAGLETTEALSSLLSSEQDGSLIARALAAELGLAEQLASLEETTWAFRRLFEALAARRPLVLGFEDAHWAEPTLLYQIEQLAERASGPMLMLCLTRPELLETRPAWTQRALTLTPLAEAEVSAIVDGLQPNLDPDARARVVEVAEGNPLFAEQLVAHAEQEGVESLDLAPPSIEALLASRLDLLPSEERSLLESAAVIGRRFSRAAVLDLSPTDTPAADVRFRSLIQKGLIRRAAGEGLLAFQHVLVRNVVYAGIPKGVRGDLHQRAAAWFEERHPDLIELDEIVGYHLEQAAHYKQELGQPDQALAERAGERLAAAGRRALWRGDNPAARSLFERALERTRPFGLDVHLELDLAWAHRNTNQAVALADAVAKQAAEARDEPGEMLAHLAVAQYGLDFAQDDNVDELEAIAHAALPLLERAEDHAGLVHVWFALGFGVANERCQYEAWTHAAEQALRHAHLAGQVTGHLFGLDYALLQGPRPADEALRVLDATVSASAPPSVLGSRAWLLAMLGRFDEAWQIAHAQSARGRDLNPETSIDDRLAGIAQLTGNEEAAAGYLRGFCDWCEERGLRGRLSTYAPELGSTLCALGRFDEAEPLAELGRELAAEQDASAQMLWRQVKARVLASRGEVERAEHLARAAVAISERTDALNYQGDALSDLAEVLHSAGQSEEATATLARSLERFERKRNLAMAERVRVRLNDYRQSTIPAKET